MNTYCSIPDSTIIPKNERNAWNIPSANIKNKSRNGKNQFFMNCTIMLVFKSFGYDGLEIMNAIIIAVMI